MNKTVNVHLGGRLFVLEEDAYQKLQDYLQSLRRALGQEPAVDEILEDIEQRISDLLDTRRKDVSAPLTPAQLDPVLEQMGSPEDVTGMAMPESEETSSGGEAAEASAQPKRLFRDVDHNIFGGVSSGLGAYLRIDPVLVRVLFVLLTLFGGGVGLIAYVILWLAMPPAKTRAEKLQMQGRPVTAENISRQVREEAQRVGRTFQRWREKGGWRARVAVVGERTSDFFSRAFGLLFQVLGKTLGVIVIAVAALVLIALIIALLASIGAFSFAGLEISRAIFGLPGVAYLAFAALLLVLGIPVLALIYGTLRLVFDAPTNPTAGRILLAGWSAAFLVLAVITGYAASGFSQQGQTQSQERMAPPGSDTLIVAPIEADLERGPSTYLLGNTAVLTEDGRLISRKVEFSLSTAASSDSFLLTKTLLARGRSEADAREAAAEARLETNLSDNFLFISPVLMLEENARLRKQQARVELAVPEGRTVWVKRSAARLLERPLPEKAYYRRQDAYLFRAEGGALVPVENPRPQSRRFVSAADEVRRFQAFRKVSLHGCMDLRIRQSPTDEYRLELTGDEEILNDLRTQVNGDELEIHNLNQDEWNGDQCEVEGLLTVPSLEKVEVSGAAELRMDSFETESLVFSLRGATSLKALHLRLDRLELDMSGAGEAEMSGFVEMLELEVSGAGDIDAEYLEVREAEVDMSGAGNATIWATGHLHNDLSGACNLEVKGGARISGDKPGDQNWGVNVRRIGD